MSAPMLWVVIPLVSLIPLLFLRKRKRIVALTAAGFALLLFLLAFFVPIQNGSSGGIPFSLNPSLSILGRELRIHAEDKMLVSYFFLVAAIFIMLAFILGLDENFSLYCLFSSALAVAAFAVDPFIYASLIIGFIVLCSIPVFVSKVEIRRNIKGLFRFISYQLLSIPFLLLAGWILAGGEIAPVSRPELMQASIVLGVGFALMLALFPFHIWMPLLAEESPTIHFGFVSHLVFRIGFFLLLKFLNNFAWMREFSEIYSAFRIIGTVMVVISGMWSFFSSDLKRIMAYFLLLQNGLLLIAMSGIPVQKVNLFAILLLIDSLAIIALSWSMQVLKSTTNPLTLEQMIGLFHQYPLTCLTLVGGLLTTWGFPLFAGFAPILIVTLSINTFSLSNVLLILLGLFFAAMTSFRIIYRIFSPALDNQKMNKEKLSWKIISIAIFSLILLIGIFPNLASIYANQIIQPFEMLLK